MANTGRLTTRDTCLVCQSKLSEILNLGLHAFADTFIATDQLDQMEPIIPLICMLCDSCGLIQLRYETHDHDRYNLYQYSYTSSNSNFSRSHWQEFASEALAGTDQPINLVVEIGSNDGFLLQQFQGRVGKVLGIDSSAQMAHIANSLEVETVCALFDFGQSEEILRKSGYADLIIANNVLNHANNPLDFLQGVANLLSDNGRFIFEVPYWSDTVKSLHFDQIYHEHVSYFTTKSINYLLSISGLKIVQIRVVDYHGGSLRVTAMKGKNDVRYSRVQDMISMESSLGLFDCGTYINYWEQIKVQRSRFLVRMHQLIDECPSAVIAGIGAAAKANTLLTFYGLDKSYITFVSDSSSYKIGKHTPLTRIPVKDDLEFAKFDSIFAIVLSWNIGETLRQKIMSVNQKVQFIEL